MKHQIFLNKNLIMEVGTPINDWVLNPNMKKWVLLLVLSQNKGLYENIAKLFQVFFLYKKSKKYYYFNLITIFNFILKKYSREFCFL